MKNFLIKNNPYIQNYDAVFIKNQLCNKILDIFQKKKVLISEEKLNRIFGIIQISNFSNSKKDSKKEKEFSEILLNLQVEGYNYNIYNMNNNNYDFNYKDNKDNYSESSLSNKKEKNLFDINNNEQNINLEQNNNLFGEPNFSINIDESNVMTDLNYDFIKLSEPKKSRHYRVKQFSFEDFILLKSKNKNTNDDCSYSHYSNLDILI